jgi:hypothetical protein
MKPHLASIWASFCGLLWIGWLTFKFLGFGLSLTKKGNIEEIKEIKIF